VAKCYVSGLDSVYQGAKTEYAAYIIYQECLLRGEGECINSPGDKGNVEDNNGEGGDGNAQDNDRGDESEEYFSDKQWPPGGEIVM